MNDNAMQHSSLAHWLGRSGLRCSLSMLPHPPSLPTCSTAANMEGGESRTAPAAHAVPGLGAVATRGSAGGLSGAEAGRAGHSAAAAAAAAAAACCWAWPPSACCCCCCWCRWRGCSASAGPPAPRAGSHVPLPPADDSDCALLLRGLLPVGLPSTSDHPPLSLPAMLPTLPDLRSTASGLWGRRLHTALAGLAPRCRPAWGRSPAPMLHACRLDASRLPSRPRRLTPGLWHSPGQHHTRVLEAQVHPHAVRAEPHALAAHGAAARLWLGLLHLQTDHSTQGGRERACREMAGLPAGDGLQQRNPGRQRGSGLVRFISRDASQRESSRRVHASTTATPPAPCHTNRQPAVPPSSAAAPRCADATTPSHSCLPAWTIPG